MEHGPHFNEEHARKAVMKMENEDGTRGPHWSIEETTTLASQYGISLIGTNGDTRPLVTYNNEPVRVENLAGTGIYLLHYNKYTNQVFLVSGGYKATATPSA
jgi:hypothetical protein